MIARLRQPAASCDETSRDPQAIGALLPDVLARYGITEAHARALRETLVRVFPERRPTLRTRLRSCGPLR